MKCMELILLIGKDADGTLKFSLCNAPQDVRLKELKNPRPGSNNSFRCLRSRIYQPINTKRKQYQSHYYT
jgi:hypothetical protein